MRSAEAALAIEIVTSSSCIEEKSNRIDCLVSIILDSPVSPLFISLSRSSFSYMAITQEGKTKVVYFELYFTMMLLRQTLYDLVVASYSL